MGIFEHLKSEWEVLRSAPLAFLGLLILGLGGGFTGGMMWRGQEVANAESLLRLRDGELDTYRKSIEKRLGDVEKQLTLQQISAIQDALTNFPSTVDFLSVNKKFAPLATQLKTVFTESGWTVANEPETAPDDRLSNGVVIRASDNQAAETIGKALEGAGVTYQSTPGSSGGSALTGGVEFTVGPSR